MWAKLKRQALRRGLPKYRFECARKQFLSLKFEFSAAPADAPCACQGGGGRTFSGGVAQGREKLCGPSGEKWQLSLLRPHTVPARHPPPRSFPTPPPVRVSQTHALR